MGGGMSKASDDGTKASTTVVGRTLASVLSHTGGEGVGGKGRLQYPRHVLAVEATEQYIVDENGLRRLLGGDGDGPRGMWWNHASLVDEKVGAERQLRGRESTDATPALSSTAAADEAGPNLVGADDDARYVMDEDGLRKPVEHDVARLRDGRGNDARSAVAMDAVEQQLSPPRESATQADAMGTAPGTAAVGAGLELAAADEEDSMTQLCARSEREQGGAWDRFSSGAIRPTDLELSEPSRPPTPPNLIRTIQENVSAARGVAYQLRRVTELTAPQLAESLGFMGLTDPRYAAHAKPYVGVAVVEDKEFVPGWVATEEADFVDNVEPRLRIRDGAREGEGVAGHDEYARPSALVSVLPGLSSRSEVAEGDGWREGHGLHRWRHEFDEARAVIRTTLAIKDSRGAIVVRKPPPPPEEAAVVYE